MVTKLTREFFQQCGARGGKARAAKLTKEQRIKIATNASRTRKKKQV